MRKRELVYNSFTSCYRDLLDIVYNDPQYVCAPRGMKIKETLGVKFTIVDPRNRLPYLSERDFSLAYCIAEMLWYTHGSNSTSWISKYSSFWSKISDDGVTANSAYGARIFKPHRVCGGDTFIQWDYVVNELKRDPDSRRAVIHIRSPFDSKEAKLDVPCTLTLQYFIRDEALHSIVSMRSSDLILGIAYDVPAFTLFQEMLALELGVKLGTYTHISNSLHIYENKFKQVESILKGGGAATNPHCWDKLCYVPMPPMPTLPPTQSMWDAESEFTSCDSTTGVLSVLAKKLINDKSLDSYWGDWVKILAAHKLSKLKEHNAQKEVIDSLTFKGYKFFDK